MTEKKTEKKAETKYKKRTIKVDYLARVEGEGALYIHSENGLVQDVKLKIFEPPRFFEAFLKGRGFGEAPDITARICGICPVAYQMSAVHAIEAAFGFSASPQLKNLRRLLYCGEWIESHVLHVYMLHAPDFLQAQDAIEMTKKNPALLKRGLEMKKIGNEIVRRVGGREIHPINVKVGGFYKWPEKAKLRELLDPLKIALENSYKTLEWLNTFEYPQLERNYTFVSLKDATEYPMNLGNIVSSEGLNISPDDYEKHFEEIHIEHSNALHSILKGTGEYLVGPMARFHNAFDQLSPLIKKMASEFHIPRGISNPFKSILIRCLEVAYAYEEAIRIISEYEEIQDSQSLKIKAASGCAATEAPRGMLYHRYQIDEKGLIQFSKIVPPTSQNQMTIESDIRDLVLKNQKLSNEKLQWLCEQGVRNYDPCISCATHFLRIERSGT